MSTPEILSALERRIADAFPDLRWDYARLEAQGYDHYVVILDEAMILRLAKTPVARR
jgi:hypothetical protein